MTQNAQNSATANDGLAAVLAPAVLALLLGAFWCSAQDLRIRIRSIMRRMTPGILSPSLVTE